MAGSKPGGKQAAETNKLRHGADYYQRLGALGGSVKNPRKGFGSRRKLASLAGMKGGRISRKPL